jgi:ABC-type lipoprotein release transport system permease subunit
LLTTDQISKEIGKIIAKRENIIKWDKIINKNARSLDKRISKIIQKGLKQGKTEFQLQKEISKTMKLNNGKARTIARTETNFYKTEGKLQVGKYHETKGNLIIKKWVYTYMSHEDRPSHLNANEQIVVGIDNKFNVGGKFTTAPQHFGIAKEDINCSCDYKMEYGQAVDTSIREFNKYKEVKNG